MSYIVPDKIPSYCAECDWSICLYPNAYCKRVHKTSELLMAIKSRPDFCPLIEIPPQARPIDANMIEYENWYLEETGESYKMVCKDDIDGMSAIIEAEGETE